MKFPKRFTLSCGGVYSRGALTRHTQQTVIRQTLWYATAYTIVVIVHEGSHALAAHALRLEGTLYHFWATIDPASRATIDHERQRTSELEEERMLQGRNLLALADKAVDLRTRFKATEAEVANAESARQTAQHELAGCEARVAELNGGRRPKGQLSVARDAECGETPQISVRKAFAIGKGTAFH